MIGLYGALGVAVAYGLLELFVRARSVLILIFLAFFIAAGLDPIVGWLVRHRMPRWAAVLIVVAGGLAVMGGVLAAAIPPMASEATALAHQVPHYLHDLQDRNSQLGKLNVKYHVQDRLTKLLTSGSGSLVGGVIGAGALVIGTVSEILAIGVLSVYFLAGLPQIKLLTYRLVPHSRRPRAILIGDEIFAKVGGYMLGSFITAVIAGFGTYIWLLAWGVPYPLLLGTFVALLDYGFYALLAPSYADIFYNNCFKNGILPVTLPDDQIDEIFRRVEANAGYKITVDLESQTVRDELGLELSFAVDPFRRECLLNRLDDIGLSLRHEDRIAAYEREHEPKAVLYGEVDASVLATPKIDSLGQ